MSTVLRFGILGAARIAPLALLEPASKRDNMIVTHVAASNPRREAEFAAAHALQAAGGYDALIRRDDIDLIYIAVPPSGHCEWAMRALNAGKAVLCEKPFSMNAEEAKAMVVAAERARLPLIEAFHYRFHPTFLRAEALMRTQAIGKVVSARASFCTTIPQSEGEFRWNNALGGGAVMDLGCYPIHALRTLIGSEPEIVAASATYSCGVEAAAHATLLFNGEVEATIRCEMSSAERVIDLEILGERGRLTISNFIFPHYGGALRLETRSGTICENATNVSTYSKQLAHIAEVLSRGARPLTGGSDAVANMSAIDAIRATARTNAGTSATAAETAC